MRNFQDTFKTRKRSIISAFSICMTVSLKEVSFFSYKNPKIYNSFHFIGIPLFVFAKHV